MSLVFIISAPSGSGKSTLVNELRKIVPGLEFSISYTTRKPRGSEHDGREYFFVTREQFERMLARDEFLEHADVFGNYYGTARRFLEDANKSGNDLLLDIDVQGAAQIKAKCPEAVTIFVLPPSREELVKRLRRRSEAEGVRDEAVIHRRLATAAKEIENWRAYEYILVNDQLEQSIDGLQDIVLAERLKRSSKKVSPDDVQLITRSERFLQRNMRDKVQPILASFLTTAIPSRG